MKPGMTVALRGGLGVGKTCFVKGMARGLGITDCITSPTYTIVCEYPARFGGGAFSLYHIDAYRLSGDEDFENTGAGELFGTGGIIVIEWSERIPGSIPQDAVTVEIVIDNLTGQPTGDLVGRPERRVIRFGLAGTSA